MSTSIRLSAKISDRIRAEAARRHLTVEQYLRLVVEEAAKPRKTTATAGAVLVARLRRAGVIGAWAEKLDGIDSSDLARKLRKEAQQRSTR